MHSTYNTLWTLQLPLPLNQRGVAYTINVSLFQLLFVYIVSKTSQRLSISYWISSWRVYIWCLDLRLCIYWRCCTIFYLLLIARLICPIHGHTSTTLKWEAFRVMYLSFLRAVTIVPLMRVTLNGYGLYRVDSLFCFRCRTSTKSPTWILDTCVPLSVCAFIFAFALASFSITRALCQTGQ